MPEFSHASMTRHLSTAETLTEAAEAQGILCGRACGSPGLSPAALQLAWLAEILPDSEGSLLAREAAGALQRLADTTLNQLRGIELDLELLLPDDDQPLSQRTQALVDWISGFLYGLGSSPAGQAARSGGWPEDMAELLADLTEITRLDVENLHGDEAEETDWMEVLEQVRLAVLYCYTELVLGRTQHESE